MVKDLTGSNGLASLCMLATRAPMPLGPALGTITDRVRRTPLPIWTNPGHAGLLLTLFGVRTTSRGRCWAGRPHRRHLGRHAEHDRAGRGAALVELVDHRLPLVLFGLALLATTAFLAQRPDRASRTAARSMSDANPA